MPLTSCGGGWMPVCFWLRHWEEDGTCPIFLRSVRSPFGTIEDRLSAFDCSHRRCGSPESNGLARTLCAAPRRKESLVVYSKRSLGAVTRSFFAFVVVGAASGAVPQIYTLQPSTCNSNETTQTKSPARAADTIGSRTVTNT